MALTLILKRRSFIVNMQTFPPTASPPKPPPPPLTALGFIYLSSPLSSGSEHTHSVPSLTPNHLAPALARCPLFLPSSGRCPSIALSVSPSLASTPCVRRQGFPRRALCPPYPLFPPTALTSIWRTVCFLSLSPAPLTPLPAEMKTSLRQIVLCQRSQPLKHSWAYNRSLLHLC